MDLDLQVRTIGRPAKAVLAEVIGPLSAADLQSLEAERGTKPSHVKRLRDSHHSLARCLAEGMSPAQCSIVTGYAGSSISNLQTDPAFQQLVSFYRDNHDAAYADLQTRMADMSLDVLEELRDRLNDNPEEFTPGVLLDTLKTLADRTGHGPHTKTTNLNVNLSLADRVAEGRRRVALAGSPPGACKTVTEVLPPLPPPSPLLIEPVDG